MEFKIRKQNSIKRILKKSPTEMMLGWKNSVSQIKSSMESLARRIDRGKNTNMSV